MGLTIKQIQEMAYETASANGWHDANGTAITPDSAYAQLATLAHVFRVMGDLIERIRKPATGSPEEVLVILQGHVRYLSNRGMERATAIQNGECGNPLVGSKTQVASWLVLIISEAIEALEAVFNGDRDNFAEELADIVIRIGDTVEAINRQPGHFLAPVNLETAIIAKNERNRARGYRHGGKRA